jgi:hypothetical protein
MNLEYLRAEYGEVYFTRGHVPLDKFMDELRRQVDSDDPILLEDPEHLWMRCCRDFQEGIGVYVEAVPESRGAFKCTWIQV